MRAISGWLAGRKTYLLAGAVILALLVLVFLGKLTPDTGVALVTFAVGGFAVTFRDALQRHHEEEIALLRGIAQAGVAVAAHNLPAALAVVEADVPQGVKLAEELRTETES